MNGQHDAHPNHIVLATRYYIRSWIMLYAACTAVTSWWWTCIFQICKDSIIDTNKGNKVCILLVFLTYKVNKIMFYWNERNIIFSLKQASVHTGVTNSLIMSFTTANPDYESAFAGVLPQQFLRTGQSWIWRSCDHASWEILIIKPTRCTNFSNLFLE